jgi:hypothetical protein
MQSTATSSSANAPASAVASTDRPGVTPDRRTGRERRQDARTPIFAAVSLRLAGGPSPGKLIPAHLVDVSSTGVGVRAVRPLAPGTEFTLEVASPLVKGFRFRVVRCAQVDRNDVHVSAEFVRGKATPES